MTNSNVITKLLLMIALGMALCGCVHSTTKVESLGVQIGDRLQLIPETATLRCDEATSLMTLWFDVKNQATCMKPRSRIVKGYDADVQSYDGSRMLKVVQIKYWNGVDADGFTIRLKDERDGREYWANDLNAPELFGLRHKP